MDPRSQRTAMRSTGLIVYVAAALVLGCVVSCNTNSPAADPNSTSTTDPPMTATNPPTSPPTTDPFLGAEPRSAELEAQLGAALQAKGDGYTPRTRHLTPDGAPKFTNRLLLENSPYLLQHAHNPVDWRPWGDAAFEAAKRLKRPVLLSVGYSTCHWCHVMEHESFEDLEVAEFINRHFIAIKVDRERRPDVDSVYMTAVHLLAGRGGWPMTVVMTPEGEPFFGGTYFPARDGDRGARMGFLTLLKKLSRDYTEQPETVLSRAQSLSQRMQAASRPQPPAEVPGADLLTRTADAVLDRHDRAWGGFGRAPKFPRPSMLTFLLHVHRRTGDARALDAVVLTLRKMALGGIYDQIGGGFHRYSTDNRWLVPHFEKMLYDNAQLVESYLDGYQLTGDRLFARIARETLDYVLREMTSPKGLFYSATDADSLNPEGHAEEGWFFTWTPAELKAALSPEQASLLMQVHGVSPRGNFEGRNILWWPDDPESTATRLQREPSALRSELEHAYTTLYTLRERRPPPLKDIKSLVSWNGLMIGALARGSVVLGEPRYREAAIKAADAVLLQMIDGDGRLKRVAVEGSVSHLGLLDDHAFLAQGLLGLFEATQQVRWLEAAIALHEQLETLFADSARGGYFMTGSDGEALLMREKPTYDGAEPSGNAVAVRNLQRLTTLTDDDRWRTRADRALAAFASAMRRQPSAMPLMLTALDYALDRPKEIIVVTREAEDDASPLMEVLAQTYVPNRVVVVTTEAKRDALAQQIPLVEGKVALNGQPTAYVCEQRVCRKPTTDPKMFRRQLHQVDPYQGP
ncbi:MAG: thioredoxin domain-containing protein [Myxococcota bacterium]